MDACTQLRVSRVRRAYSAFPGKGVERSSRPSGRAGRRPVRASGPWDRRTEVRAPCQSYSTLPARAEATSSRRPQHRHDLCRGAAGRSGRPDCATLAEASRLVTGRGWGWDAWLWVGVAVGGGGTVGVGRVLGCGCGWHACSWAVAGQRRPTPRPARAHVDGAWRTPPGCRPRSCPPKHPAAAPREPNACIGGERR